MTHTKDASSLSAMDNEPTAELSSYQWDNRPKGVAWIDKLTADEAKAQCLKWSVEPAPTLEANRVRLKDFVRGAASNATETVSQPGPQSVIATINDQQVMDIIKETAMAVGAQLAVSLSALTAPNPTSASVPSEPPRIASNLLSAVQPTSGTNPEELIYFLSAVKQVLSLQLADDKQIMLLALPKTKGQLRTIWGQAVTNSTPFLELVEQIKQFFLPPRVRQHVLENTLYRDQKRREPLSEYIQDITTVADILEPDMPQQDILDAIVTGINPVTRAKMPGFPAPATIDDLLRLAPRLETVHLPPVNTMPFPSPSSAIVGYYPQGVQRQYPNQQRSQNYRGQQRFSPNSHPRHLGPYGQNYQGQRTNRQENFRGGRQ